MADFKKILIANRGEIAIRIMRAANEMGKKTVAVFAEEDKLGLHRFKADEAYRIGEGLGPVAAYLSIDEIIRVARECGADAIHQVTVTVGKVHLWMPATKMGSLLSDPRREQCGTGRQSFGQKSGHCGRCSRHSCDRSVGR